MSDLVPRRDAAVPGLWDVGVSSTGSRRRLARAVEAETERAIVRARRVQGAAFVTETALTQLELLGHLEASVAKRDPVSAERAQGFIEDFVLVARNEMRKLAQEL